LQELKKTVKRCSGCGSEVVEPVALFAGAASSLVYCGKCRRISPLQETGQ